MKTVTVLNVVLKCRQQNELGKNRPRRKCNNLQKLSWPPALTKMLKSRCIWEMHTGFLVGKPTKV